MSTMDKMIEKKERLLEKLKAINNIVQVNRITI